MNFKSIDVARYNGTFFTERCDHVSAQIPDFFWRILHINAHTFH